jgi:hypothetical protein
VNAHTQKHINTERIYFSIKYFTAHTNLGINRLSSAATRGSRTFQQASHWYKKAGLMMAGGVEADR